MWWLARSWRLLSPSALLLAAAAWMGWVGDIVLFDDLTWGFSAILYGAFSHAWSVVLSLCYLAAVNRLVARRQVRWWLLSVLALVGAFLCHPLSAVLAGAAVLVLVRMSTATLILTVSAGAAGLTAFWWLPFVGQSWLAGRPDTYIPSWSGTLPWIWHRRVFCLLLYGERGVSANGCLSPECWHPHCSWF